MGNRAETRKRLSPRSSIGAVSASSYSSAISPTISSSTSSMLTKPAIAPYSSTSRAMWLRSLHFTQQRVQRLGVGHEDRRAHHLRHLDVSTAIGRRKRLLHQVFQVHHPDDVVDIF